MSQIRSIELFKKDEADLSDIDVIVPTIYMDCNNENKNNSCCFIDEDCLLLCYLFFTNFSFNCNLFYDCDCDI
jgi:hypothetical protein